MIARTVLAISAAVGITAASVSCRPVRNSSAAVAPDSVTGTVAVTGTSFEKQIVLRPESGRPIRLTVTASDSSALSRMTGVEVRMIGKRNGDVLEVEKFAAVRVAGLPVVDGVLRNDGGRLVLDTSEGTIQLGNPPDALRGMVGARVWISGPLDKGPNTYGLIVPAR